MLCDTISRKTLFYLIATLNAAFPDYDFSMAKVHFLDSTESAQLSVPTISVDNRYIVSYH